MIPLYGFLKGDTLGLLILAQDDDTVEQLGQRLQQAAQVRVASQGAICVMRNGKELSLSASVRGVGFQALEKFEVELRNGF